MTGDLYIQSVIDQIPSWLPLRDQIAMELRAHIVERTAQGQPLNEILRQLGDPRRLAESYLASVPLTAAPTLARLFAKVIDAGIVCLIAAADPHQLLADRVAEVVLRVDRVADEAED